LIRAFRNAQDPALGRAPRIDCHSIGPLSNPASESEGLQPQI
jgi:hypothetical protein